MTEYFVANSINLGLVNKIVELTFDNFDLSSGEMLVSDLTSCNPDKNILNYSVEQYIMDNPDISDAVKRGLVPSEIDHFLRFGYFEILKGRRFSTLCLSHERKQYNGKLLYIVDDFNQLNDEESVRLKSIQLDKLAADIQR